MTIVIIARALLLARAPKLPDAAGSRTGEPVASAAVDSSDERCSIRLYLRNALST